MDNLLPDLLADFASLLRTVGPDRFAAPTPCPEYDVAALRQHVLSWLPVFAAALDDPAGAEPRPDPQTYQAPADPDAAAAEVGDVAQKVTKALAAGVADIPVQLLGAALPGSVIVGMVTGEVIAHGWDLARATARPWSPDPAAADSALATMRGMLTPEIRGSGMSFGPEVAVPDDASEVDRLLAFTGRDPAWRPAN
jgi:uncharacterized protein (TIGR03086 family)